MTRAEKAVKLLTKIRNERPDLWQQIVDFAMSERPDLWLSTSTAAGKTQ